MKRYEDIPKALTPWRSFTEHLDDPARGVDFEVGWRGRSRVKGNALSLAMARKACERQVERLLRSGGLRQ